uniref:JNK1/MAPK8-associated membrane protein n=1 Tax=Megaselia scalaris TaxID=36166 RepID=T1GU62_MEGSC
MEDYDPCPGLYCGRVLSYNGSLSDCGECPRGFRVNSTTSICVECTDSPNTYDFLYITFICILPLIMHWYFIDACSKERTFSKNQIILHISAFFEVVISAVISVFLIEPIGVFYINSCGVKRFSDWYTLFYNPTPNYEEKLYCTTEAANDCPDILLSMPGNDDANKAASEQTISKIWKICYYAFPYLSIIMSMISNACHFAVKHDQKAKALLKSSVTEFRNILVIIGHWLLLAFGILSLGQDYWLLIFVPSPSLFYIMTVQYTDPSEFPDSN